VGLYTVSGGTLASQGLHCKEFYISQLIYLMTKYHWASQAKESDARIHPKGEGGGGKCVLNFEFEYLRGRNHREVLTADEY
jgi:hypothetical protein